MTPAVSSISILSENVPSSTTRFTVKHEDATIIVVIIASVNRSLIDDWTGVTSIQVVEVKVPADAMVWFFHRKHDSVKQEHFRFLKTFHFQISLTNLAGGKDLITKT